MLSEKRQEFASVKTFESCLTDTFWRDILNKRNLSHIVFYDKENLSQEFTTLAANGAYVDEAPVLSRGHGRAARRLLGLLTPRPPVPRLQRQRVERGQEQHRHGDIPSRAIEE